MAAAMGLLLGGVQLLIWMRLRSRTEFLLAAAMSFCAGIVAVCEAGFLGQPTAQEIQTSLEFQNIAIAGMLIAMVWFVYFRLRAGRKWLAWGVTAIWVVCVVASIVSQGNLTFATVEKVDYLTTPWGEAYGVASGEFHPFKVLADMASLAIMIFVGDAAVTAYRAGRRQKAIRTGGAILFFIVVAGVHTPMVDAGLVKTPFVISLVFVAICFSLALDLADDVVRSVQLNAVLLKERQRWDALTENVDLAVIRVDGEGRIAYVNPFLERISGRSVHQLVGAPVSLLVPEEDRLEVEKLSSSTLDWKSRARKRRPLKSVGGATHQLVWYSVGLRSETGEADGFISFGQDITDQMKAEDESRTTRREIERLTRALALGELSSSLAHELSQPVAAILSNTQTLQISRARSGAQKDETDEILQDIFSDTQRAKSLLHQVREFVFKKAPETEIFDFTEAVSEVVEMLTNEAQTRQVRIKMPNSSVPCDVDAARLEIQQVIMNLLLNSIQAIGDRGNPGRILVSWQCTGDQIVKIAIDDNGPGLKPEVLKSAFDPFVTTKSTGTGIGLAVSKRIVERHGGSISASQSELGGARFTITLPIQANEDVKLHA